MESMIARLNQSCPDKDAECTKNRGPYPLRNRLKTRNHNDPSIAWLDAWATVADVLTFYQERVANEGFLATAVQERSLHEISSLVGYLPRPGLSSSVMLAFEVEKPVPAANGVTYPLNLPRGGVLIPAGTAVESTPAPGSNDESQTFETSDDFVGFEHWNAIKIRTTRPQRIDNDTIDSLNKLYLKGTGLGLKINDFVFVNLPNRPAPVSYAIQKITEDQDSQVTRIDFRGSAGTVAPLLTSQAEPSNDAGFELCQSQRVDDLSVKPEVFLMRSQCNVFGWNMPPKSSIADSDVNRLVRKVTGVTYSPPNTARVLWWTITVFDKDIFLADLKLKITNSIKRFFRKLRINLADGTGESANKIFLDGEFSGIRKDDYIAIRTNVGANGAILSPYKVTDVNIHPRASYQLRGNCTEVILNMPWWPGGTPTDASILAIQSARVYCEAQTLELAEEPLPASIDASETTLELDGMIEGLFVGQQVAIQGKRASSSTSNGHGELATISRIRHVIRSALFGDRYVTEITVLGVTDLAYIRSSVRLMANIVEATHGKTVYESVGDGDGFREFLKHQLTASPVSQLPIPRLPGSQNEIKVFVEDVRWPEISDFVDIGPTKRAFVAKRDFMQRTKLVFGDGADGARPPTGIEIIKSRYRTGLGVRGNVASGRIDQVAGSTLGVKSVINPMDATGGEDADGSRLTRTRAPLSVTVFDRLVSISDYECFALKFAGIGKAKASFGGNQITLTIAANHPGEIASSSKLFLNLSQALKHYGEDQVAITLTDRELLYLAIHAKVQIKALYQWQVVQRQIRNALLKHFSYEHAGFGGTLYAAEALQVIQSIEGVTYAELPTFVSVTSGSTLVPPPPSPIATDVTTSNNSLCYLSSDFENLFVVEQLP
jgi:hypothetical protein